MSNAPITKAVAKVLAEETIEASSPSAAQRQRAVDAIRAQLAVNAKRRARRPWVLGLGAAAAIILVGVGTWRIAVRTPSESVASLPTARASATVIVAEEVHGAVFVELASGRAQLSALDVVPNGESIITGDGDATLSLQGGSRIRLDPKSDAAASLDHGTHLVHVKMGAVTAMVAKLSSSERFLVRTDEAEVEAHGTVFKVTRTMQAECGARTAVHVVEGRISIRDVGGERFLGQSEDWTSPCATRAPAPQVTASVRAPIHAAIPAPAQTPAPLSTVAPASPPEAPPPTPEAPPPAPTPQPSVPHPEFGRRK